MRPIWSDQLFGGCRHLSVASAAASRLSADEGRVSTSFQCHPSAARYTVATYSLNLCSQHYVSAANSAEMVGDHHGFGRMRPAMVSRVSSMRRPWLPDPISQALKTGSEMGGDVRMS